MANNHPAKRRYAVTILRRDGTPWVVEGAAKHVIYREYGVELYFGEHGKDRLITFIPYSIVDHIDRREINENGD